MYKIAIIGAGQIGSRHLQALAQIKLSSSIEAVGRSPQSLRTAKRRFKQVHGKGNIKNVSFFNSISALSESIDVGVIATNSDVRRKVVEELILNKKVKYLILEKVVFQSNKDFWEIITLLNKHKIKAWVNCPRRMFPFYKEIKESFKDDKKISLHVQGGNWGMACNSIHFLDFLSFLSGDNDFNVAISSRIDSEISESKRKGFIELTGVLNGSSIAGNEFSFVSKKDSNAPGVMSILGKSLHYIVFEAEGKYLIARKSTGWKWKEVRFAIPEQSQLTHLAVEQIIEQGKSDLTPLEVSWKLHKPLLKIFKEKLEKITGMRYERCPIT